MAHGCKGRELFSFLIMKSIKLLAFVLLLFASCNKDEVITEEIDHIPVIELDSETGIYTIKTGRELTITPTYQYADDALFAWTIDGKLVSTQPVFKYTWDKDCEVYVNLRVDNAHGSASEELKVEVMELTPPVISLVIPSQGLKIVQNTDYTFTPDIQNADLDKFSIEWLRGDKVVSTQKTYTFNEKELGTYPLTIRASNIDGSVTKELNIEVVETMPYVVTFPTPSLCQKTTDRNTFAGRPVYLKPTLAYFDYPKFEWSVNGAVVNGATERTYKFTPTKAGEYTISLTVSEGTAPDAKLTRNITRGKTSVTTVVKVICADKSESALYRAATSSSSMLWNKVYEYLPAPGQFINELPSSGFIGNETTQELAIEYATKRLEKKYHVSLGSFGGYIIVGFDHSIPKTDNEYDISIQGNAFKGSSEPGIVWVMQDVNGNGLPDDEWFELKGSETGKKETVQNFEATYFRPGGKGMNVQWISSEGKSGWVDYLSSFHTQDYYYPLWVKENSYVLSGTCLAARNVQSSESGYWDNQAYDWGYVDNFGNDQITGGNTTDGSGQRNGFKISNAIFPDGTEAKLQYVDFIKVQCGVLAKSGWLGEVSTEVFSFQDLSKNNN